MHIPVMLKEVLEVLAPKPGGIYIDATVGLGGHAKAIADRISPRGLLIGIDRDEKALRIAADILKDYNVKLLQGNFRNIDELVNRDFVGKVDGVLFDLGVSSLQLEDSERGFSFLKNGPLDMRMGSDASLRAVDIVNRLSIEELVRIFKEYGEERNAYIIAKAIVDRRGRKPIETTSELVEIIRNTLPKPLQRRMGKHPARKVFQALRIAVNEELDCLERGLNKAFKFLKVGGILCVISYHSLEDRIVKEFIKKLRESGEGEPLFKKVLRPTKEEVIHNPRSRSAKLRAVRRVK